MSGPESFCLFPGFCVGPEDACPPISGAADLQIQMTKEPQKKPSPSQPLQFGKTSHRPHADGGVEQQCRAGALRGSSPSRTSHASTQSCLRAALLSAEDFSQVPAPIASSFQLVTSTPGDQNPLVSMRTVFVYVGICTACDGSLRASKHTKAETSSAFRPWLNMDRMLRSARRLCSFAVRAVGGIRQLVEVDKDWVPDGSGTSLYVRPVLIGNETP
ncbi:Branched-chain-amino-acid aminotransferase [Apodemus speciosus]|uniref:branched-chain-amino-acid transaminase n=1 Tax=Apodemus speciosus TaxID=105296 RepID=A0ABQ0EYH8_APOSI